MISLHAHDSIIGYILSRVSPGVGLAVIVSSLMVDGIAANPWDGLWKTAISIGVGVFVTLTGMIYHNLENRIAKLEDHSLPRREFDFAHKAVLEQLTRIEKHIESIDTIGKYGRTVNHEGLWPNIKLVEYIISVLYPGINAASWMIVIYKNVRYKKRIAELEKFKQEVEAALSIKLEER